MSNKGIKSQAGGVRKITYSPSTFKFVPSMREMREKREMQRHLEKVEEELIRIQKQNVSNMTRTLRTLVKELKRNKEVFPNREYMTKTEKKLKRIQNQIQIILPILTMNLAF